MKNAKDMKSGKDMGKTAGKAPGNDTMGMMKGPAHDAMMKRMGGMKGKTPKDDMGGGKKMGM